MTVPQPAPVEPVGTAGRIFRSILGFAGSLLTILTMTCGDTPDVTGCQASSRETDDNQKKEIVIDNNILVKAWEGKSAEVDATIGDRRLVIPNAVVSEFLAHMPESRISFLYSFMARREARLSSRSEGEAQRLVDERLADYLATTGYPHELITFLQYGG
ncbi:hypothetical protein [Microbispora catharanthi]|uniref:Uncharacterized protein n=1 Tax=Microbispora catharanthi TaxID=1712871 RepID=A0A5N6AUG3_9ACTN|nr:hypothetical protein [Microbispora catharanthi]KAB8172351.1 hypothetical protein FH610_042430 [Microbispora catharanthi]